MDIYYRYESPSELFYNKQWADDLMLLNTTKSPINMIKLNATNGTVHNSTTFISNDFIFLESKGAQAFAGSMAFIAIIITCHQVPP